jgi:hypothetical protein
MNAKALFTTIAITITGLTIATIVVVGLFSTSTTQTIGQGPDITNNNTTTADSDGSPYIVYTLHLERFKI